MYAPLNAPLDDWQRKADAILESWFLVYRCTCSARWHWNTEPLSIHFRSSPVRRTHTRRQRFISWPYHHTIPLIIRSEFESASGIRGMRTMRTCVRGVHKKDEESYNIMHGTTASSRVSQLYTIHYADIRTCFACDRVLWCCWLLRWVLKGVENFQRPSLLWWTRLICWRGAICSRTRAIMLWVFFCQQMLLLMYYSSKSISACRIFDYDDDCIVLPHYCWGSGLRGAWGLNYRVVCTFWVGISGWSRIRSNVEIFLV